MNGVSALRAAAVFYSGLGIVLALANILASFEGRTYSTFATSFSIALSSSCLAMGVWTFFVLRRRIRPPLALLVIAAVFPFAFVWGGLLLVAGLLIPAMGVLSARRRMSTSAEVQHDG